jgi:hypothetical protein
VAKQYKKPDLNAPRYRPKKLNLTNTEFYNKFIQDNPKYAHLTFNQFKEIIKTFNGSIWKAVVEERDGIQLPEQLGYLFIGSCPRKVGDNTDYKKSEHYGVKVQNQNWESDQFVAKIFYTNFETKYRFKNHDLWGFTGVRDFKRSVAKEYPSNWKKYLQVENKLKISRLFRLEKFKQFKTEETAELLKNYDEFNLE